MLVATTTRSSDLLLAATTLVLKTPFSGPRQALATLQGLITPLSEPLLALTTHPAAGTHSLEVALVIFNVGSNNNSFFGNDAGKNNTASFNSFFPAEAGSNNTSGTNNAFFGFEAGLSNDTGLTPLFRSSRP